MARRPPATKLPACVCLPLLLLLVRTTTAQEPPHIPAVPPMSEALQEVFPEYRREESSFWNLWEYSLEHDAPKGPVIRGSGSLEAKTVLAPSKSAEMHLIPQDAGDVRFGTTPAQQALRQDYLLDHLLTDSLAPSDPRLPTGVSLTTASGKDVTFTKDENGVVLVNGVVVERTVSLPENTYVYFLSDILFDNRQRVSSAFHRHHAIDLANDPLGPPLDLEMPNRPTIRAPAPPPPGTPGLPKPPAIPLPPQVIRAPAPPDQNEPRPPAIPIEVVRAPAPPSAAFPPASPPRTSEVVGPPAAPPPGVIVRAPAPPPRSTPQLVGPPSDSKPPAKSPAPSPRGVGATIAATLTTVMLL